MIKKILFLVVVWRVILFGVGSVGDQFIEYRPSFPYSAELLASTNLPRWLYSWGNFDGVHYITIMIKGYFGTGLIQAFFPAYPGISSLLTQIGLSPFASGMIVSHLFFGLFIYFFYKLILLDFHKNIAFNSILILLLFPTSFYLGAVYSESMFLFFIVAGFYFARTSRWAVASIFTALACSTRLVGIGMIPALIIELYLQNKKIVLQSDFNKFQFAKIFGELKTVLKKNFKTTLIIFAASGGLLAYLIYLQKVFSDWLIFFRVQSEFGAGREESVILLPQVIFRYVKILITSDLSLGYFASLQELVLSLFALIIICYALGKIRLSYIIFSMLAFIVPTLTGTFSSMPRYVLACFVIFMLVGKIISSNARLKYAYLVFSSLLLIINLILFLQGYWVA